MPMTIKPKLGIFKIDPAVETPHFATEGSACFDLRFFFHGKMKYYTPDNFCNEYDSAPSIHSSIVLEHGYRYMVPTGIIFDIPEGFSLRLHPRSGLALKYGLQLANCEAVIDSDYVDETFVLLQNTSQRKITIVNGERICQAELVRNQNFEFVECGERIKQKTDRVGGFGSTGT